MTSVATGAAAVVAAVAAADDDDDEDNDNDHQMIDNIDIDDNDNDNNNSDSDEEDKSSLFLKTTDSDFVVIVGDQRLCVHKSILQSSSEYFMALFNSDMIETKTKEIVLKETLVKPFLLVLKLTYNIQMSSTDWFQLKIPELFESVITANKYQFVDCERQLSEKLMNVFAYRSVNCLPPELTSHQQQQSLLLVPPTAFDGILDNHRYREDRPSSPAGLAAATTTTTATLTIWELLEMAKLHNLHFLTDHCLRFFDENLDYSFDTFDQQFISADILRDVISRDTFGAREVDIFKLVRKWISKCRVRSTKRSVEEQELLECVRLNLIQDSQLDSVYKSGLYEPELIDRISKHELTGILAQNRRICLDSGHVYRQDCSSVVQSHSERSIVVYINCLLPMPTKINHLMFRIQPTDYTYNVNARYWIGVKDFTTTTTTTTTATTNNNNTTATDSTGGGGGGGEFRKVLDYTQCSCVGDQDIYFDQPFITDFVRIVVECNNELFPYRLIQSDDLFPGGGPPRLLETPATAATAAASAVAIELPLWQPWVPSNNSNSNSNDNTLPATVVGGRGRGRARGVGGYCHQPLSFLVGVSSRLAESHPSTVAAAVPATRDRDGAAACTSHAGGGGGGTSSDQNSRMTAYRQQRCRQFLRSRQLPSDPNLFNIKAIRYEYSKCPLRTIESFIVADGNVCLKSGSMCCSKYFGPDFTDHLTDRVLNNKCTYNEKYDTIGGSSGGCSSRASGYTLASIVYIDGDYETVNKSSDDNDFSVDDNDENPVVLAFNELMQTSSSADDFTSDYVIRLPQPVYADCLQLEVIIENDDRYHRSRNNTKKWPQLPPPPPQLAAECLVEICPQFTDNLLSSANNTTDWHTIGYESYLMETGYYNLEFAGGPEKVSAVRLTGFRYNSDRTKRYPLNIRNFSLPADRQSDSWLSANHRRLANESMIDDMQ
ncbi:uncharacterized protein LOC128954095 [Oppia nitens]|uniref:uncharacterized protein LOC128954095 n=1 Tax=Oppia nitens TaxID=1686743 RepID=UPI0023DA9249|nr:uncharacterized protein LOC128954095 [Oppia nitens]